MSDKKPVTKAMIMGAGLGTRMAPLTDTEPKPLVKFAGRPLIDHALDRLEAAGVETVIVNLHYLADRLEAHLKDRRHPHILFSDERDLLMDTGGGIKKALPLLGADPFFTFNSDSVWIESMGDTLKRMIDFWDPARMDALMLVAPIVNTIGETRRGDFAMDPLGLLARREQCSVAPFMFAGVQIIDPKLFAKAPDGPFSTNLIWDEAIGRDRLFGLRLDGMWMHLGTPGDIEAAEDYLKTL